MLNDASVDGNINIVKIALMKGANVNCYEYGIPSSHNEMDDSPESITYSVVGGHINILKYLLSLLEFDLNPKQKRWLLCLASGNGGIDMVKYLTDEMGSKPDNGCIDEASHIMREYEGENPDRVREQKEIIKHLRTRM